MGKQMIDLIGSMDPAVLLANGYAGAFGYVSHNHAKMPAARYGEALVLQGGLFAAVFEDAAKRPLDGYQAGRDDAAYADGIVDGWGYPPNAAIYFTADFDADPAAITDYWHGLHDASTHPIGIYAGGDCIRHIKSLGFAKYGWRTCSGGFKGSHDLTGCDLLQHCDKTVAGHSVDVNDILSADIGAWGQGSHPIPQPTPPSGSSIVLDQDTINQMNLLIADGVEKALNKNQKIEDTRNGVSNLLAQIGGSVKGVTETVQAKLNDIKTHLGA